MKHNGTEVNSMTYNGQTVNSWVHNGVEVFAGLISFTISGITYKALPDMIWREWVASEYSKGTLLTFSVFGNYIKATDGVANFYVYDASSIVYSTGKIKKNNAYTINQILQ